MGAGSRLGITTIDKGDEMTNREKLEWAAKACGYEAQYVCTVFNATDDKCESYGFIVAGKHWRPHIDQADSDVMACKLRIGLGFFFGFVEAQTSDHTETARHNNTDEDVCRAVREARLLVAVEIGRAK